MLASLHGTTFKSYQLHRVSRSAYNCFQSLVQASHWHWLQLVLRSASLLTMAAEQSSSTLECGHPIAQKTDYEQGFIDNGFRMERDWSVRRPGFPCFSFSSSSSSLRSANNIRSWWLKHSCFFCQCVNRREILQFLPNTETRHSKLAKCTKNVNHRIDERRFKIMPGCNSLV